MSGERDNRSWHLEKTISVGHIMTTLTVAGGLMLWGMKTDTRISVLEAEVVHQQQSDERQDKQWQDSISRIEHALIRIEDKLDTKKDKR